MINILRNNIKMLTVVLATSFLALAMVTVPASAQTLNLDGPADVSGSAGAGTCLSTNESGCDNVPAADEDTVNSTVALVVNIFSWVVGVISVIMIIFGGFKYITSGGDSSKITDAKNTILYALIGLIIVALAQVLVRFVLGVFSSESGVALL